MKSVACRVVALLKIDRCACPSPRSVPLKMCIPAAFMLENVFAAARTSLVLAVIFHSAFTAVDLFSIGDGRKAVRVLREKYQPCLAMFSTSSFP